MKLSQYPFLLILTCSSIAIFAASPGTDPVLIHKPGKTLLSTTPKIKDLKPDTYWGISAGRDMGYLTYSDDSGNLFYMQQNGFISELRYGISDLRMENRLYWAAEAALNFNSSKHQDQFTYDPITQWNFTTHEWVGGGAHGLIGFATPLADVFYLKLGLQEALLSSTGDTLQQEWVGPNYRQMTFGYTVGLGESLPLTPSLQLLLDYSLTRYRDVSRTGIKQEGEDTDTWSKQNINEQFSVGINYWLREPHALPIIHPISNAFLTKIYLAASLARDELHINFLHSNSGITYAQGFNNSAGFSGTVQAGYGHTFFGPYYTGLEVGIGYDSQGNTEDVNSTGVVNFTSGLFYQISLLPGYQFSPNHLAFLRLGIGEASFERPDSVSFLTQSGPRGDAGPIIPSQYQFGYQIGAGLETITSERLSIRIEYLFAHYTDLTAISGSDTYNWTPWEEQVILGLKFVL